MSSIRRRSSRSAFTLIELLLVLVILAVLAGIVIVSFTGVLSQGNDTKVKADISNMDVAIEKYNIEVGDYPKTLEDLNTNTTGSPNWKGPYLKKPVPNDPWGHPYRYSSPGAHNPNGFDLSSDGDGKKPPEGLDNWSVSKK